MPVAEPFEQLALDSHMAVAGQGRLFVVITLQPPTVDSLERFRRCIVARHDAVGDSLLGVVTLGSRRPSLEAGARLIRGRAPAEPRHRPADGAPSPDAD